MANILDHLAWEIYEGIAGRSETRLDKLTLLNVWKHFIDCAMRDPQVTTCVLQIKRTGDHFEVLQLMLNSRRDPITQKGEFVFGRSLKTYSIDDDLLDVMNGREKQFFQLSALWCRFQKARLIVLRGRWTGFSWNGKSLRSGAYTQLCRIPSPL